jgi:hypothetical protein
MAVTGYVNAIINGLAVELRQPFTAIFDYVMREYSLGEGIKAENFSWYRIEGTTHATPNTEFTVAHGMDHAPSKLIPIVALDVVNSALVPLTVSRVSDIRRIYLKSSVASATFAAYLE